MPNPLNREKTYEALAFFAGNVKYAGQIKLYKLLYYLDLVHFRRTGRKVTDLIYEAWPRGPVPAALDAEFRNTSSELYARFRIKLSHRVDEGVPTIDSTEEDLGVRESGAKFAPTSISPQKPYKHEFLSRREMQIASDLAEIFYEVKAQDMTDISHQKFGPWQKALFKAKKQEITSPPIDLTEGIVAVCDPELELPLDELREIIAEREESDRILS